MSTIPDGVSHYGGVPVGELLTIGMGQVYFVCPSANALYGTDYIQSKMGTYPDGTERMHTTIQSALDATVTNRNDYVIVLANIDISDAALTMTKNRVHLISPVGLKPGAGHPGDWAIYQTGSYDVITITGHRCEVAGFVLLGKEGQDIIDIGTTWDTHIHHNYFGMAATGSSNNYGIRGTASIQFSIHHNMFTNHSPGAITSTDNDIKAFIGITSGGSTRGVVSDNIMHTGANTAVATGITLAGYGQFVLRNYLWEDIAFSGAEKGTLTIGITTSTECLIADNRIGMAASAGGYEGAGTDSFLENYVSTATGGKLGYTASTS